MVEKNQQKKDYKKKDDQFLRMPFEEESFWESKKKILRQMKESPEDNILREFYLLTEIRIKERGQNCEALIRVEKALHQYIAELCLNAPETFKSKKIPLSFSSKPYELNLNKLEALTLVALMYFRLFPNPKNLNFFQVPCDFNCILTNDNDQFLLCLLNYFKRTMKAGEKALAANFITYKRVQAKNPSSLLEDNLQKPFKFPKIILESMDEVKEGIHIDFANAYIGGGALVGGCVQEEIKFFLCPELFPTMLIFQRMDDLDSIVIFGAEQYSRNSGYGYNFCFEGDFVDSAPLDEFNRKKVFLSAIDAIICCEIEESQFSLFNIDREIFKAVAGFQKGIYLTKEFGKSIDDQESCPKAKVPLPQNELNEKPSQNASEKGPLSDSK